METVDGGFGEESLLNTALFHSINVAPVSGSDRHDFSKNDPLPFTIVFAEKFTRGAIIERCVVPRPRYRIRSCQS